MDSFLQTFLPAFLAFLLGLVAEPIKRAITREKRRILYEVVETPVISVSAELPKAIVDQNPNLETSRNISQVDVTLTNAGSTMVNQASCQIRARDAEILAWETSENPAGLVAHRDEVDAKGGTIRISDFSLEPGHSLSCRFYTGSAGANEISFQGLGGQNVVNWIRGGDGTKDLDDHLLRIFKLWIFATFITPLLQGVTYLGVMLAVALAGPEVVGSGTTGLMLATGPSAIANVLGSILSLYFYLLMIPPVARVLAELERAFRARTR
jgi:hypothetical protein